MFLKNCWYVAGWSKDIGRELLGRVLLNEYVVLYRKEDGTPVALETGVRTEIFPFRKAA